MKSRLGMEERPQLSFSDVTGLGWLKFCWACWLNQSENFIPFRFFSLKIPGHFKNESEPDQLRKNCDVGGNFSHN